MVSQSTGDAEEVLGIALGCSTLLCSFGHVLPHLTLSQDVLSGLLVQELILLQ